MNASTGGIAGVVKAKAPRRLRQGIAFPRSLDCLSCLALGSTMGLDKDIMHKWESLGYAA